MAGLEKSDRVEIRYEVAGCFGSNEFEIVITGGRSPMADIKTVTRDRESNPNALELQGRIPMSSDDLAGLDALLAFYRNKRRGGCSSVDTVRIHWIQAGRTVRRETFIDASCSADELPERVTLSELLGRVAEPRQATTP